MGSFNILPQCGVYKITCISTGKIYVGSSNNCSKRISEHKSQLRNNRHHSGHLQKAFCKYGPDSFVFEVIEYCDLSDKLMREQHWIEFFHATDHSFGFNVAKQASSSGSHPCTDEVKIKLSISVTKTLENMTDTERSRRKNQAYQIGKRNAGKTFTDEQRAQHIKRMREKHPFAVKVLRSDGVVYNSFTQAGLAINASHKTIAKRCHDGKAYNGFTFMIMES